jgi:hypothetical protein
MKNPQAIGELDNLFRRWPTLLGFSLQDAASVSGEREWVRLDAGLSVADVGMEDWMAHEERVELLQELATVIAGLMEELPEALELLRGRTFARTLH